MSSTRGGGKAYKPRASQGNNGAAKPSPRKRGVQPQGRRKRIPGGCVKAVLAALVLVLAIAGWAAVERRFAPTSNTDRTRFDALIVLGARVDADGNPTPAELARVNEAVREYERGVAPHIILTGGAARNQFVEAEVMARTAQAEGVPASAIVIEGKALNTTQNLCYSSRLMKQRGWGAAEIISSASHLPRAALIAEGMPMEWRTHPAPPLAPSFITRWKLDEVAEELKTVRFLLWSRLNERCEP